MYSGELYAATMFVDISGFSAMTDTLMAHGQHGAEVAADIMRAALDPAIETVFRYGGFVANQAGDAITAVFPVDEAGSEADTARGRAGSRGRHSGAAAKPALFWLALRLPSRSASRSVWPAAESSGASSARLITSERCTTSAGRPSTLAPKRNIRPNRATSYWAATHGRCWKTASLLNPWEKWRLVEVTGNLPAPAAPTARPPDLALMRHYFPASVLTLEHSGEFRWVTNVFVALPTVRTDIQLHAFMQTVFELQKRYGGFINRLDFGDKGANLLIFWGAPIAHENDIQRWGSCSTCKRSPVSRSAPGVTYRIAHAGTMGARWPRSTPAMGVASTWLPG